MLILKPLREYDFTAWATSPVPLYVICEAKPLRPLIFPEDAKPLTYDEIDKNLQSLGEHMIGVEMCIVQVAGPEHERDAGVSRRA